MIRSPRVAKRIEGHYGITANCRRQQKLARCRELLAPSPPAPPATPTAAADPGTHSPVDSDAAVPRCPRCGGPLRVIERLAPTTAPYDTS